MPQKPTLVSDISTLGRRIRFRRLELRLAVPDLARITDLNEALLASFESDEAKPQAAMFVALADALEVTIDWLMLGPPGPDRDPSPELQRFLTTTAEGAYAQEQGLVKMLANMQTPFEPDADFYRRIVTTFREFEGRQE